MEKFGSEIRDGNKSDPGSATLVRCTRGLTKTEKIWRQVLYWSEEEKVEERVAKTRQMVGALMELEGGGKGIR